jgi:hypothetical protein
MQTNDSRSIRGKGLKATMVAAMALSFACMALSGCNDNPAPGSTAYKEGELGNGDFLFACDDGVACLPYSGDAKKFPTAIASGATFDVRFVAKNQQGTSITIDEKRYDGITTVGLAPYVSSGPSGFSASKPGFGTILVRDSGGTVIDYVTLKFVKPDTLVVYDAAYDVGRGKEPPAIQALNLKVDDASSYRVVAQYNRESIAGSIPVEWESESPDIVEVESYTRGVVNLRAKGAGKTTLVANGGGLAKTINVEVTP